MKAIFLSDAHLRDPQDENYRLLLELLERQENLDALFLLGDIFEFWLGYEHLVFAAYVPLLERLRRLSQRGTRLYFVEGNHDFQLGPYFRDTLGCHIITSQQNIDWDGLNIHLCHGDLVHPTRGYLWLRRLWRSRLIKILAGIVHPDPVWRFGVWLSDKSQKKRVPQGRRDPTPWLLDYARRPDLGGVDLLVCGHFHHPLDISTGQLRIIALGDWLSRSTFMQLDNGKISVTSYADGVSAAAPAALSPPDAAVV
ncbi:MAG: UDP-2,3-diacylglucosamine diphosphatase [Pelovirga sp.]